jgi:hypothetical protein
MQALQGLANLLNAALLWGLVRPKPEQARTVPEPVARNVVERDLAHKLGPRATSVADEAFGRLLKLQTAYGLLAGVMEVERDLVE